MFSLDFNNQANITIGNSLGALSSSYLNENLIASVQNSGIIRLYLLE
jgi:hypothetical protein